ncbi:sialidase family protein [Methyloglobulus sp.]|uniref:sialidase family protein n=1 Tax=Methyloglobulus sp. TaxID=2518622 RepID=UPI003989A821
MKLALIKTVAVASLLLCQDCHTASVAEKFNVRELTLPAVGVNQQHHLTHTADGKLILSWVETRGSKNTVRFAVYDNAAWLPMQTVISTDSKLADPPVVQGLSDGTLAAAWMLAVKNDKDPYAADIYLAHSKDGGQTWTAPIKPYGEQARIYDAQMSLAPLPDAGLALVWTDSRHVIHDDSKSASKKTSRHQLMATVLNKDWQAGKEITLDDDVCSCCSTYTDVRDSELVTVYRDHLKGEVRDISAVRWNRNGAVQATPVHDDHWVINGCPSNGPSVDLSGQQTVVAWFTAGDGKGRVRVSFSAGGDKFKSPIEVDDQAIGYANALLLDDGSALVSWRHNAGPEEELMVARVTAGGEVHDRTTVYRGSFARWPSKYLGIEKIGNEVFIAWTDPIKKKVRLAVVAMTAKD